MSTLALDPRMNARQAVYWRRFLNGTKRGETVPKEVCWFGDTKALANQLAAAVVSGKKRACISLLRDFDAPEARLPESGDLCLVLDGFERPRAVIETTRVVIKPFIDVTGDFAFSEGEGMRSRAAWLRQHRGFFQRQARREGRAFHDALPAVFERFQMVWS